MSGDTRQISEENSVLVQIGRHLARMYEGYLNNPLPERFLALLARLDEREQDDSSAASQDGA